MKFKISGGLLMGNIQCGDMCIIVAGSVGLNAKNYIIIQLLKIKKMEQIKV